MLTFFAAQTPLSVCRSPAAPFCGTGDLSRRDKSSGRDDDKNSKIQQRILLSGTTNNKLQNYK